MLLASPGALAGDEGVDNDYDYITVLAGDTLWDIASLVEPTADPRDVVAEIMSLNRLANAVLTPGQQLAIPR
jgi:LysM repeat protein